MQNRSRRGRTNRWKGKPPPRPRDLSSLAGVFPHRTVSLNLGPKSEGGMSIGRFNSFWRNSRKEGSVGLWGSAVGSEANNEMIKPWSNAVEPVHTKEVVG